MKIYTSVSEWLRDFPKENSNEKLLKIINRKAEIEFKRIENKKIKEAEKVKKQLAKKQQELEVLMSKLQGLESAARTEIKKTRKPRKPRQQKS